MLELIHMTWKEVGALDRDNTLIVMPIASIEQHGPHLPVGTDYLIMQGLVQSLLQWETPDIHGVILPTLQFGLNMEHYRFPGTVCTGSDQILRLLTAQADSFVRHGFHQFALLNSHGGNMDLMDSFIREYRMEHTCTMTGGTYFRGSAYAGYEKDFDNPMGLDVHAGEFETSIMLYLFPELVDMNHAPLTECNLPADALPPGWLTHECSQSGIIGDASLATREKGQLFFQLANKWIREFLTQFMARPPLEQ